MAVYRRRYRPPSSERTPRSTRFLVFSRYAARQLLASRLFVLYLVLSFGAPLVGAVLIYLHYNPLGLQALQTTVQELIPINGQFFLTFLTIQTSLGSVLAAVVGPGLIAPDLTNNALPLYLSRPVGRRDYILGKLVVLAGLMSILTWIPILALFALQSALAGWSWFAANWSVGAGIAFCSAVWILVVSMLTLAVSAWVRWRPLATLAVFGYFAVTAALSALVNEILATELGTVLNAAALLLGLWPPFFGVSPLPGALPAPVAVAALAATCAVFLAMLLRRIRAFEVVR